MSDEERTRAFRLSDETQDRLRKLRRRVAKGSLLSGEAQERVAKLRETFNSTDDES